MFYYFLYATVPATEQHWWRGQWALLRMASPAAHCCENGSDNISLLCCSPPTASSGNSWHPAPPEGCRHLQAKTQAAAELFPRGQSATPWQWRGSPKPFKLSKHYWKDRTENNECINQMERKSNRERFTQFSFGVFIKAADDAHCDVAVLHTMPSACFDLSIHLD